MLLIGSGFDAERTIASSFETLAFRTAMPSTLPTRSSVTGDAPFHCLVDGRNVFTSFTGNVAYLAFNGSDEVEFASRCWRTRPRNGPPSSWKEARRREGFLRICSICDRCELAHDDWSDLPEAMKILRLLERRKMPGISRGLCPHCYVRFTDGVDRPDA